MVFTCPRAIPLTLALFHRDKRTDGRWIAAHDLIDLGLGQVTSSGGHAHHEISVSEDANDLSLVLHNDDVAHFPVAHHVRRGNGAHLARNRAPGTSATSPAKVIELIIRRWRDIDITQARGLPSVRTS
jgi:hypothetical protein